MKKLIFNFLLLLFVSLSANSQITGKTCVGLGKETYECTIEGDSIIWHLTGPANFSNGFPSINIINSQFVEVNFHDYGNVTLQATVYDSGSYVGFGYPINISVKRSISNIQGSSFIKYAGNYTYTVNPIPGITSYTWIIPSTMTGSSTSNSITLGVTDNSLSGIIKVSVDNSLVCKNESQLQIKISECIGNVGEYSSAKISGRVVSGDFDNDGKDDDIAAFYDYGNSVTKLHVWKGNNTDKFIYQGDNGWWSSFDYNATKLVGVVTGDFDNDGFNDDIAAFYDYGNNETRIHVWRSNGSTFVGSMSSVGWFTSNQYNANKIKGRIVSGDFDNDGFKDDIAAFYDYGNNETRIHVWKSNGSTFAGSMSSVGWYTSNQYNSNKITYRVVSGDFDRDGFNDDIAAFYDYGNNETRIHVWNSTGTSFGNNMSTVGWYTNTQYNANKITGRVVSGDFDRDGYDDDIAAFYDYGNFNTSMHIWNANANSFTGPSTLGIWNSDSYDANKLTDRVVSGSFFGQNSNRHFDIVGFYAYSQFSTTAHIWRGLKYVNRILMTYQGDNGWFKVCYTDGTNLNEDDRIDENKANLYDDEVLYTDNLSSKFKVKIYPNPSDNGIFSVISGFDLNNIKVYDLLGNLILQKDKLTKFETIDLSEFSKGVYYIEIINELNDSFNSKVIIR